MELNKIYQGDCLELMKSIADKSIDMILCDLPYGTTACKWDNVIPFEPLWEQYKRIIKDNGAIVLTASQPFTSKLVLSNLDWFKYEWIWEKSHPTGFATVKYMPMKKHENILVFGKGRTTYNYQETTGSPNHWKVRKEVYIQESKKPLGAINNIRENKKYPTSIQKFNSVNKTKILHTTQKPVALFEYLIKTYTNEGDLVLDNCIGSGTTAIACLQTNRNFIGMELEEKYVEIANKRIADFNKQLVLV